LVLVRLVLVRLMLVRLVLVRLVLVGKWLMLVFCDGCEFRC
jgi:hypothetical protein